MKKILFIAIAACGMMSAQAQQAYEATNFGSNWSIGLHGGVTTPLSGDHAFFGAMRGTFGLHIQKQITPVFSAGVEGTAAVNTSSWDNLILPETFGGPMEVSGHSTTAIDRLYVGVYGGVDLVNLFGGYKCGGRVFGLEAVAGAGWGHDFYNQFAFFPYSIGARDQNYFVTKAGLKFNFNIGHHWTITLNPYVAWNMTGTHYNVLDIDQTSAAYDIHRSTFNCDLGLTYNFGEGFACVDPADPAEIDALNARINQLRGELDGCKAGLAAKEAAAAALEAELAACKNRKPEVIKEVSNNLNSVRYVFFKIGQSTITNDQRPNVEMIADYLKHHADSKVVIKGYASKDGNLDFNIKLAQRRAEAVKTMLVKKYGIAADRITAEGEGIGEMFKEESWNRVAICTLD